MDPTNAKIRIRKITDASELQIVEKLAAKIFPETYRSILSPEQIPYMMQMMYADAVLQKEFAGDMHFALILDGEKPVGYVSWHPLDAEDGPALKLEKLYLDFAYHGRGIGNLALKFVIAEAADNGCRAVFLNVNKDNLRAQKAYVRAGFTRFRSEENPIGGGYYMDDYVMKHDLPQQSEQ